jgi:excisionase family DNA binding protein
MNEQHKKRQLEFLNRYFLSTKEAIMLMNVSQQTFYEYLKRDEISRIKLNGAVLYKKTDVEELKSTIKYKEETDE